MKYVKKRDKYTNTLNLCGCYVITSQTTGQSLWKLSELPKLLIWITNMEVIA